MPICAFALTTGRKEGYPVRFALSLGFNFLASPRLLLPASLLPASRPASELSLSQNSPAPAEVALPTAGLLAELERGAAAADVAAHHIAAGTHLALIARAAAGRTLNGADERDEADAREREGALIEAVRALLEVCT